MKKKDDRKRLGKLGLNRHHWINRVNGGKTNKRNISWLKIAKHRAWHILFNNLSLREVIRLLKTLPNERGLRKNNEKDWLIVFKNMTLKEAIELLERTYRIKKSQ